MSKKIIIIFRNNISAFDRINSLLSKSYYDNNINIYNLISKDKKEIKRVEYFIINYQVSY